MGKAKRKGRVGGAAMMVGMFFATLFDPKKAAAVVHIDTQRRIGSDNQRCAAAASAPPVDGAQCATVKPAVDDTHATV